MVAISANLRVKYAPIADVRPYEDNPRHNDEAVEAVAASIREFGWKQPIVVDADGTIVVGHTRWKAAKRLGMDEVPVVVASDLTPEQCAAYRLADNRVGELAEWDADLLAVELDGLANVDMEAFGFDESDFGKFGGCAEQPTVDDVPANDDAEPRVKRGEVWALGRHRLMCGDATSESDVSALMDGNRADVCFTSPPYNLMAKFHANSKMDNDYLREGGAYSEYSDDLSAIEYADMLCASLENALSVSDDVLFNIGCVSGALEGTALFLGKSADRFGGIIGWKKDKAFVPSFKAQHGCHTNTIEPIYVFTQKGFRKMSHPQWDLRCENFIETENASGNEFSGVHGATFPVSLASEAIRRYTKSSVLDLFGGTGTTLIAAEQISRTCYMMEIDPRYCDIIIDRWERLTGKTAVRVDE